MGLTATAENDSLVIGGSNGIVSFWNAEAGPHVVAAASDRSNGKLLSHLDRLADY